MKPRCQGHHDGGSHTSFLCVLDEDHDGFCEPYVPPTVDEWRAMTAERDALKRRAEEALAERTRQMLLATAANLRAQKADAQAGAGRVAIRMLMEDHDPDTYSRCQDRECDHARLATAALGDGAGQDVIESLRAAEAERDALRRVDAMRAHGVAKWESVVVRLRADLALYQAEAKTLRDKLESGDIEAPWRAEVARLQSELDALRAIIESGRAAT